MYLPDSNEPIVFWKDFDSYFVTKHTTLKGISKFHSFAFTCNSPVNCTQLLDSDTASISIQTNQKKIDISGESSAITPSGLTLKIQWNLYKQVRNLCTNGTGENQVTPMPPEELTVSEFEERDVEVVDDLAIHAKTKTVRNKSNNSNKVADSS